MKIRKVRFGLIILTLTSLFFFARGYSQLWDISDWPIVDARITSYESGAYSKPSHSKYRMQSVHRDEWSRIEYEYAIDGISYTARRISPNITATLPYLSRGEKISAFYNPNDHSESYLLAQRYHNPFLLGLFVASIFMLGFDVLSAKSKEGKEGSGRRRSKKGHKKELDHAF